jgi:beta-phosphoglucomutase-like phosphatase (HAD superfamily)
MHPIKSILFDLDGVLVNSRVLHYETFRDALKVILPSKDLSWAEHETEFDGLSTKLKVKRCVEKGWISDVQGDLIFDTKQRLTQERLPLTIKPSEKLRLLLITLNNQGFR